MRRFSKLILFTAACICLVLSASAGAQEGDPPVMSPEAQAEMEMWMKLAQPAEHHEHLAALAGTWNGEVSMWMAPGTDPMTETSTAEAEMILGGRFLSWTHTGNFAGSPFSGISIEAYNNGDQRYESVWLDNFGTLIMFYEGSCSDDGRLRTMSSSFNDPMSGRTIAYRTETKLIDDDHFTYTAYMDKGDGEFKNLVIRFERQ